MEEKPAEVVDEHEETPGSADEEGESEEEEGEEGEGEGEEHEEGSDAEAEGPYEGQEDLSVHEVWALVRQRDAELFSARQTARGKSNKGRSRMTACRGRDGTQAEVEEPDLPDNSEENRLHRVQKWSKYIEGLLSPRTGIVADIVNRLVLKRSVGERAELRAMGGMLQERFLAVSLPMPASPRPLPPAPPTPRARLCRRFAMPPRR